MIRDALLLFSAVQLITASAFSDTIDLSAYRDIGTGSDVVLFASVDTAFTAAGAGTLTISLETDDNSAFSSATTLLTTTAIGKATLVVGYQVPPLNGTMIPQGAERYLRLNYTVATGPMTAGAISAGLVLATQSARAYPNIVL